MVYFWINITHGNTLVISDIDSDKNILAQSGHIIIILHVLSTLFWDDKEYGRKVAMKLMGRLGPGLYITMHLKVFDWRLYYLLDTDNIWICMQLIIHLSSLLQVVKRLREMRL